MNLKKAILHGILSTVNLVVRRFPIRENHITFVSLESDMLEGDLLQIYEEIKDDYTVTCVLMHVARRTLWTEFRYLLNAMIQVWQINRSKVVVINDNNYVVSAFKRTGVEVIQVWHATGAVKRFGNCLEREYKIRNYDYIIANGAYWKKPFSEAFGVREEQVYVLGMPRVDKLYDRQYRQREEEKFYQKYPQCSGKKLLLYAPTFRGNIHKGLSGVYLGVADLMERIGEEWVLLYKYHPLLAKESVVEHPQCINVSAEELYQLFFVSDQLISDYSSIIFDYSLLEKPMIFYVPDLEQYREEVGLFIEYDEMPGAICQTTTAVAEAVNQGKEYQNPFGEEFFLHTDGQNTKRIVELIRKIK